MTEIRALFLFSAISNRVISPEWMHTGPLQTAIGLVGITAFVVGLSTLTYCFVKRPSRDLLRGRRPVPGVAPSWPMAGE